MGLPREWNGARNIVVAISSFAFALANYAWQYAHPTTAMQLLASMERSSSSLSVIGHNGRPTLIDFWAPWCPNCRLIAPTLRAVEREYGDRVNFVLVNADVGENWPLIRLFGVDAIPHLALVDGNGYVETALIGPVSRNVLRADIDAMLDDGWHGGGDCDGGGDGDGVVGTRDGGGDGGYAASSSSSSSSSTIATTVCRDDLPYVMYDAFGNRPEGRRVDFVDR
ncbi:hypothetical protein ACHAXA_010204 [Cyclostephanos tholiformis]|uniref:Thioredoxin domain-containing protein n=1 Tax=Cyclostephanos tholiformis TaxID=382380 RepID=A0ABD3SFX1_9STRA